MEEKEFKSGFAAITGRTNVGKSTLLNNVIGQKLTIMSDKPQTTRHKIQLVYNGDNCQVVFLDTPGIHKPGHKLGGHLVDVALGALQEMDVILFMVEPYPPGPGDRFIMDRLKKIDTPVILVINKIDTVSRNDLIKAIDAFNAEYSFAEIVPISALDGENVEKLLQQIVNYLPPGPKYYPDDMVTDRPERFLIAELIREKVLHFTAQEVPHSIAVVIEEIKQRKEDLVLVRAFIYVERDSQKSIIIGKNGSMLKRIGEAARQEVQQLLGSRVYLDLWVKVKKDWRNREDILKNFGYVEKE